MSDLGNKEVIANNIKYYLDKLGKERSEVCKAIGVKYSTFSEWVNGNKYPRIDKIELLANYFGVQKSDLIESKNNRKTVSAPNTKQGIRIPVLGRVAAGIPIEAIEDIEDYEEIPKEMAKIGEYFALKIKGDSMEPKISDGDVVIVRKQNDIESGEIGVIIVNGCDATVKKVIKQDGGILLVANNQNVYQPVFYDIKAIQEIPVIILGKVVELRAKF